jgi:hypothetical protein
MPRAPRETQSTFVFLVRIAARMNDAGELDSRKLLVGELDASLDALLEGSDRLARVDDHEERVAETIVGIAIVVNHFDNFIAVFDRELLGVQALRHCEHSSHAQRSREREREREREMQKHTDGSKHAETEKLKSSRNR